MKNHIKNTNIIFLSLLFFACEPIATEFDDIENAVMYQSASLKEFSSKKNHKSNDLEYSIWCCAITVLWGWLW
jgi:hypothetical protein